MLYKTVIAGLLMAAVSWRRPTAKPTIPGWRTRSSEATVPACVCF